MKELNKSILSVIGILLLGLGLSGAFAQTKKEDKDKKAPPTQTTTRKPRYVQPQQPEKVEYEDDYDPAEYERFQKIYNEKEPTKSDVDGLINYIQNGPSLALKTYAIAVFSQLYHEYLKANNWQALATTAEKFLKIPRDKLQALDKDAEKYTADRLKAWEEAKPNERGEKPTPLAIQGERTYALFIAAGTDAYFKLNNKPKMVEWGERYFAETHKLATAYSLAVTYRDMKNDAKFVEWAKKTLEMSNDNNINTELSVDLFRYYADKKDPEATLKYARAVIKFLPNAKKPEALSEAKWTEYKNGTLAAAYFLEATTLYNQKQYEDAIKMYRRVLQYDKNRDKALVQIGQAYWHLQNLDKAMLTFAQCHKMKGEMASVCREKLEEIYKPQHNGTTIGIDKVYQRAAIEKGGAP